MMVSETPEYLTVRELAELLRVKERKVYALASSGEVPCSRATGKLIFPRAGVEAWLARHSSAGMAPVVGAAAPVVCAGSHDPLLDWALRESRSGIATFFDGSLDGLERLRQAHAIACGLHLYEPERDDWNRGHLEAAMPGAPLVLLEWAWRERGLIVPADNPEGIAGLADLAGLRFMPRQPEAGSQVLFETLVARQSPPLRDLTSASPPARSEADVAAAVAEGTVDAGFGLAALAHQFRLGFVPLLRERFDLAMPRKVYFDPPMQSFLAFCRTPAFAEKARALGGYDISGFGRVRYNGP